MLTQNDQVALVTGATGGVGSAISRHLKQNQFRVCGSGRKACSELLSQLDDFIAADLASDGAVAELANSFAKRCKRLDVLVHSAAALEPGLLSSATTAAQLDEMYRVNVRSALQLTQALLPLLAKAHGQIVFINSSAAHRTPASVGAYAATKHAARAIADGLRDEVNERGIRVLSVFCGKVATSMQEKLCRHEGRPFRSETMLQPDDVAVVVGNALLVPRTAEVTNIHIRPMRRA